MPQVSKAQAKKQIRYLESGEAVYVVGSAKNGNTPAPSETDPESEV